MLKKVNLTGGRTNSANWKGRKKLFVKRINHAIKGKVRAMGVHAKAFDFELVKGKHKVNLVVKKYRFAIPQNRTAKEDYTILKTLRINGYSTPPTIRLIERNGKTYVALTDLTKYGDVQIKYPRKFSISDHFVGEKLVALVGKKEAEKVVEKIKQETSSAWKTLGIHLEDSWEIIINTKTKTARAFIIDTRLSILHKD
ncbi:MAG: hypothetical protein WCW44_02910 [archaeon]|jgi:hypothetical protein